MRKGLKAAANLGMIKEAEANITPGSSRRSGCLTAEQKDIRRRSLTMFRGLEYGPSDLQHRISHVAIVSFINIPGINDGFIVTWALESCMMLDKRSLVMPDVDEQRILPDPSFSHLRMRICYVWC